MSFGSCGAHMPSSLTRARSFSITGIAPTKPCSSTASSAGITMSAMKRSILSSKGRTLSGGSKSMSVLRVQLGREVMSLVERDQRHALGMPVEVFRTKPQLGNRCIADHDTGANHVVRARAEDQADRDADRSRRCNDRDARAALYVANDLIEPALHALRELADALDALDGPLVARPAIQDRVKRFVG